MLVAQHLFGHETLQQPTAHESAQDALAQADLCLDPAISINAACRAKDDTRSGGINTSGVRHLLKHTIDHTDMKVNVLVQTGAKPEDKGHCTDVQSICIYMGRTGAVCLQAVRNDSQKNPQHHVQHYTVACPADIRFGAVVIALPVKLTCAGQLQPGLVVLGHRLVKQRALGMARVVEFRFG